MGERLNTFQARVKSVDWSRVVIYIAVIAVLAYVVNDLYGIVDTPATNKIEIEIIDRVQDENRGSLGVKPDEQKPGGDSSSGNPPPSPTPPPPNVGGGGSGGGSGGSNGGSGGGGNNGNNGHGGDNNPPPPQQPPSASALSEALEQLCETTDPLTGVCIKFPPIP